VSFSQDDCGPPGTDALSLEPPSGVAAARVSPPLEEGSSRWTTSPITPGVEVDRRTRGPPPDALYGIIKEPPQLMAANRETPRRVVKGQHGLIFSQLGQQKPGIWDHSAIPVKRDEDRSSGRAIAGNVADDFFDGHIQRTGGWYDCLLLALTCKANVHSRGHQCRLPEDRACQRTMQPMANKVHKIGAIAVNCPLEVAEFGLRG
jgi:hypothetical protein